ncbi:polyketide cyclase/dehydrase [Streptomyces venezuelae]|uniref:Polyketide cyclase/dehydrase n=1 Tax=Streptomyces venezuelae TaxID=54571 RepID=A0A5P2D8Y8_STRVZ|nr:SRPBCC family protein [Streptomyces venezuelae]QES51565.1 polyketide cyclase/dehydrase [Streptomyces venezuelae]
MGNNEVSVEREIAAPMDEVWQALTDLESMPLVLSGVDAVEVLTPGPFGVGTRWRETRRMFGKSATEEMWVTACDTPERYVAEADNAGMHYVSEFRLTERAPGRTAVRMTFSAQPQAGGKLPLLTRLLSGLGARAVAKAIARDLADVAASVERRTA